MKVNENLSSLIWLPIAQSGNTAQQGDSHSEVAPSSFDWTNQLQRSETQPADLSLVARFCLHMTGYVPYLFLIFWISMLTRYTDVTGFGHFFSWGTPCSHHVRKHNHGTKTLYSESASRFQSFWRSISMIEETRRQISLTNDPYMRYGKLLSNDKVSWHFVLTIQPCWR